MRRKIPEKKRKKYYFIIFLILPICFTISFFLATKIFSLLDYHFDFKGWVFVIISLVPLYVMSVMVAYRRLSEKEEEKY
jgi:uncharacterized BrkB/YihY/UPF0761 family membrane protein